MRFHFAKTSLNYLTLQCHATPQYWKLPHILLCPSGRRDHTAAILEGVHVMRAIMRIAPSLSY